MLTITARDIKTEAIRLGFDLVGITSSDAPESIDVYQAWLKNKHHGNMAYLEREDAVQRRGDPKQILPGCKSIISLGIRYNPSTMPNQNLTLAKDARPSGKPPSGRVASYAWGDDYHDVLPDKLKALVQYIETQTGCAIPNRCYTDTGPILEHDLAQRAGLGWIGKNSLLINPKLGSYFMLAEILLGIELPADTPFQADHCGSCTRCLDACPTNCILPNRTIDARACISYLTIELKTAIPSELRSQIGDWIFGCDVCQDVCPWNLRFASEAQESAFAARPNLTRIDLQAELTLSPQAFNRKFNGSPIKRTKRRGYLRNVAVALGNVGEKKSVPALVAALNDNDEALVRGHAAWALERIGGSQALDALKDAKLHEQDAEALTEVSAALAAFSTGETN